MVNGKAFTHPPPSLMARPLRKELFFAASLMYSYLYLATCSSIMAAALFLYVVMVGGGGGVEIT